MHIGWFFERTSLKLLFPVWGRVRWASSTSLPWNRCWCLCRTGTQGPPVFKVLTTGASPSILLHQQFETQLAIIKHFFQGRGESVTKKQKEKSKMMGRGQSAGGKLLDLITSSCIGRQGIFSHSPAFLNTLSAVPCMCWHWQWMAHHSFLQSIDRQDYGVSSPRKPRQSASFCVVLLFAVI